MNVKITNPSLGELESPPIIPPRSSLYCLEPIGLGTAMVECLTSYIARLAAAHSVRVSTLMRDVIGPMGTIGTVKGSNGKLDLFGNAGSAINGSTEISKQIVQILSSLTGHGSLDHLTMQFTSRWLSVRDVLSRKQQWCSTCLKEISERTSQPYYPLLWQLKHVRICPKHQLPLATRCPACQKTQHALSGYMAVGFCPHCAAWLGNEKTNQFINCEGDEFFDAKTVTARRLRKLLADRDLATDGDSKILSQNVEHLVKLTQIGSVYALSKLLAIHRDTIDSWTKRKQLPSIPTLLLVSAALDVHIANLVCSNFPRFIRRVRSLEGSTLASLLRPPLKRHDIDMLREEMALAADYPMTPPASIAQVCRKVGIDPNFAVKKFPVAAASIKKHWRSYQQNHKQQRQQFVTSITKSVTLELASAGKYPSMNRMKRKLPPQISLREEVARKTWKCVLEETGWDEAIDEPKK